MQLVQQTQQKLELEHRPMHWIIGLGLVCAILAIGLLKALFEAEFGGAAIAGVMLGVIGWVWLTQIFLTVRLIADCNAGTLRISTTSLFGERFKERALGELTGAEVETRYSEDNSNAEPGLVLKFGDERHPMRLFRPDPADLLQAAAAINTWLAQAAIPQSKSTEEHA